MVIKKKNEVATTEAAPAAQELDPTQQLRSSMTAGAWQVLVDLIHWADMWEMIFEGHVPEWDDDVMINLMRPFIGFGPHPDIWQYCIKMGVGRDVITQTYRWVNDEEFRKTKTFRWLVVEEVAPTLAAETRQFEGMKQCHEALARLTAVEFKFNESEFESRPLAETPTSPPRNVPQATPRRPI